MADEATDDGGEDDILSLQTDDGAAGERLDRWLTAQCPDLSRTRLQALIGAGAVLIDGAACTTSSHKLLPGLAIEIAIPPAIDDTPLAEDIPLDIVYEDDELLVINKPAGLVVHPGAGHATGTLVNALLHHCAGSLSGIGGVRRPGIVHRLDKETSGLMLVAKTDRAHAGLSAQLADRSLSRRYRTLVWGVPQPRKGRVEASIGRHPTQRLKMAPNVRGGRAAATQYEIVDIYDTAAALLDCRLESGRTHQVRVHMALLGHPVVGDPLYGAQPTKARSMLKRAGYDEAAQDSIMAFPRQALHAWQIAFIHPVTEEWMTFDAPLPADFQALVSQFSQ